MKKTLIALMCGLALTLSASNASALAVGDANYLGQIINGAPANPEDEVTYINSLLDLGPGAAQVTCSQAPTELCDRINSTLAAGALADAVIGGSVKEDPTDGTINVTGFQWLLAKYGGESLVWYVGNLSGNQSVPLSGLSHLSLYNPGVSVPDGGATLGLLGLGMLGLGYLRRRKAN